MNYLVADYAGIASNCELAKAIKRTTQLNVVYEKHDPYGLDNIVEAEFGTQQRPFKPLPNKGNNLIIVSTPTLKRLLKLRGKQFFKNWKNIILIVSDGWYMWDYYTGKPCYKEFNKLFKDLGLEVWLCHDKLQFREDLKVKEFYQPFDFSKFDINKNKQLTISHSPFKGRSVTKGTNDIIKEVRKFNVKFDLITGLSWNECMKRKAKSHIFIDQIKSDKAIHNKIGWIGGIGKSGFEAMGLDNVLICRGKFEGLELPPPPVCWIEDMRLNKWIQHLTSNEDVMIDYALKQRQWFNKYCNPDYQAKRILNSFV